MPSAGSGDMDDLDLTSTTSGLKSTPAGRRDADNMAPCAAEMSQIVRQRKSEAHLWEGRPLEGWSVKGRQGCTGPAGSPRAFQDKGGHGSPEPKGRVCTQRLQRLDVELVAEYERTDGPAMSLKGQSDWEGAVQRPNLGPKLLTGEPELGRRRGRWKGLQRLVHPKPLLLAETNSYADALGNPRCQVPQLSRLKIKLHTWHALIHFLQRVLSPALGTWQVRGAYLPEGDKQVS